MMSVEHRRVDAREVEPGATGRYGRLPVRRAIHVAVVVLAAVAVIGCVRTDGRIETPSAPSAPSATPTDPLLAAVEIERAIEFRMTSGLRFDEAWVRAMAVDPTARDGVRRYSVPLTPAEIRTIEGRARTLDEILAAVEPYGEQHPEGWGGAYHEPALGRVVVLLAGDRAVHEADLRRLVRPDAPLVVEPVQWPLAELAALQDRVTREADWLNENGFFFMGVGVDVQANRLVIDISSANAQAPQVLAERFDAAGRLRVRSDGTGVRLLPKGSLVGVVVDRAGNPVPDLDVEIAGDIPGGGPNGDIGHGTSSTGEFEYQGIAAIGYEVRVFAPDGDGRVVVGTARAEVRPGATTFVKVIVGPLPGG